MGLGRLLIFVDQTYWRRGSTVSTDEAFALFAQALFPAFDRAIILGRLHSVAGSAPYVCPTGAACEFRALPYYRSLHSPLSQLRVLPGALRVSWRAVGDCDALLLGIPNPWALVLRLLSAIRRRPAIFLVRQDLAARVRLQTSWVRRALGVLAVKALEGVFVLLSRRTLTFTVPGPMYRRYSCAGSPTYPIIISLVPDSTLQPARARSLPTVATRRRLIWVGRIHPDKGLDVLLEAFRSVLEKSGPLELDLVGNGPAEEALHARVRQMGLDGRVRLHGYVPFGPRLRALYDQATIFVLSSESEGFPQVIVEAMSMGVPVVSTAVGGIPAVLEDHRDALLVPARDPRALASAVLELLSNQQLYERLSAAGLELARRHTLEAQRDLMLERIAPYVAGRQKGG